MSFTSCRCLRVVLVFLFGCHFELFSSAGPKWWRLRLPAGLNPGEQWLVCQVRFWSDINCQQIVYTAGNPISEYLKPLGATITQGNALGGVVFGEFQYTCPATGPACSSAWLGARFVDAVQVRCVSLMDCSATSTTTTRTITTIKITTSASCTTGSGANCKTCTATQCTSCNPGYFLQVTTCQAWGCHTASSGSGCNTCMPQSQRTAHNHCQSCHTNCNLAGTDCSCTFPCTTGTSGTSCKTCAPVSQRTKVDHCASCQVGHMLQIGGANDGTCLFFGGRLRRLYATTTTTTTKRRQYYFIDEPDDDDDDQSDDLADLYFTYNHDQSSDLGYLQADHANGSTRPELGARRLQAVKHFPSTLRLERSDDGSTWHNVADWTGGVVDLTLDNANVRYGQSQPPQPATTSSWNPTPATSCSLCSTATTGAQATGQNLVLTFNEWVFPGSGNIQLNRGGMSTLTKSVNSSWFSVSGLTLTIDPQEPLGTSGSCTQITIPVGAVVDADGVSNSQVSYKTCIIDTTPPTLHSTTPTGNAQNVPLAGQFQLSFNEAVQVMPGTALVVVQISRDPSPKANIGIDMQGSDVTTSTWNSVTQGTTVTLNTASQLARWVTYRLEVPGASIQDKSGNAIPGTIYVTFTTVPAGLTTTTTAKLTPGPSPSGGSGGSSSGSSGSSGPPVYVYIIIGVLACLLCGGLLFLWRMYVRSTEATTKLKVAPRKGGGANGTATSFELNEKNSETTVRGEPMPTTNGGSGLRGAGWGAGAPATPKQVPSAQSVPSPKAAQARRQYNQREGSQPFGPRGTGASSEGDSRPKKFAKEAEDAPNPFKTPPPPFNSKERKFGRGKSFTDEATDGTGWVKTVDPNTGRPYWFHRQTLETRWDKPSSSDEAPKTGPKTEPHFFTSKPSTEDATKGPQRPKSAESTGSKIDSKVLQNLEENEEIARVKDDVNSQLEKTRKEDVASRKKTFKFLCLRWHPDKNAENPELATAVFQFLQQQRDWYLKDA